MISCQRRLLPTSRPSTRPVSPCIDHIPPYVSSPYSCSAKWSVLCIYFLLHRRLAWLLAGRSRSPTRSLGFNFFARSIEPCRYVSIPIPSVSLRCIFRRSSSSPFRLGVCFSRISTVSLTLILFPPRWPMALYCPRFLLRPFILSRLQLRCFPLFQPALPSSSSIQFYQLRLEISSLGCSLRYIAISIFSCLYSFWVGTLPVLLSTLKYSSFFSIEVFSFLLSSVLFPANSCTPTVAPLNYIFPYSLLLLLDHIFPLVSIFGMYSSHACVVFSHLIYIYIHIHRA